jgi:hypothetical protein
MDRKQITLRYGPRNGLEQRWSERAEAPQYTAQARSDLTTYYELIPLTLARLQLSQLEALTIIDALADSPLETLRDKLAIPSEIRFAVQGELSNKVRHWSPFDCVAVADAVLRYRLAWARGERNRERMVRFCGLTGF